MKMKYTLLILIILFQNCKSKSVDTPISVEKNTENPVPTTDSIIVNDSENELENKINAPTITHSTYTKEEALGKINFSEHEDFTMLTPPYTSKNIYLRKEVAAKLKQMIDDAKSAGVQIKVISGGRNFDDQKGIWERKWVGKYANISNPKDRALGILEWSSMPGTSRHHWGTDVDINALTNEYFESGNGKKEYDWLVANAPSYGFCQVYDNKTSGRTGYNQENWHWSYLPIAKELLKIYNEQVSNDDIQGFKGSETAKEIDMKNNYVNGISKKCQ